MADGTARILRDADYATFLQDENFGHTSFMARMREGFDKIEAGGRLVALLSRAYMQSEHCTKEAHYPLTDDPSNRKQRLIVLRIEDCAPSGFLKDIPYIDLAPLLHDADAFARAVRGAIDRAAPEADFATLYQRAPTQILHPEIRPVPNFAGRAELLDGIDRALWSKGGAAALTNANSAAVHGLGGVGKSVLAREYAWRNCERYRGVWWVRAETEQTLIDDLIALGGRLAPGLEEIPERDRAAQLALDAIAQTGAEKPWLLIYDNAEKPSAIDRLMPRSGAHLIVTSRWPGWKGRAEPLPVDVFPPDVAIEYLLADTPFPDRAAAARCAEALGYLPLALSHARAYCAASNLGFDAYRARMSERIKDLPDGADYPSTVFATFSLAIEKAAATCPEAEKLMSIAAFLAPDRIPLDIVTADVIGEAELNKAVATLYNVSLITHDTLDDGSRGISMHRLVQEVMRARLVDRANDVAMQALQSIFDAFPEGNAAGEHTAWPRVSKLLAHAISVLQAAPDRGDGAKNAALLNSSIGTYLQWRGAYVEAEPFFDRAIAISEKALGPDHPSVAINLNNLAIVYLAQGRCDATEPLHKRALTILEKALGPDHPNVATSLNNLAVLYRDQGRHKEAEPLFIRAIAIAEQALGPDHPNVGNGFNNLAGLYRAQGRRAEAEPLLARALAIFEKSLGPDHPNTKMCRENYEIFQAERSQAASGKRGFFSRLFGGRSGRSISVVTEAAHGRMPSPEGRGRRGAPG